MQLPALPRDEIGRLVLDALRDLVRVDSQSDEASPSIPSTPGQERLAAELATRFADLGAQVQQDAHANVIARWPGRLAGADKPPVAFMAHLDTSRGTEAVPELVLHPAWDGRPLHYPDNPGLRVDLALYPELAAYLGQDLVHGPGRAPFGLDNKLGLAQLLGLARLLAAEPALAHPPLLLIARPDEEIGRHAAVEGLAAHCRELGVPLGFTVDGLLPFEVNVENFNAAAAAITFPGRPLPAGPGAAAGWRVPVALGGVNTHGATARAEGYRAATRLAAEVVARLAAAGQLPARLAPVSFASDPRRDCDATMDFLVAGEAAPDGPALAALREALAEVVGPHLVRGASWSVGEPEPAPPGPASRAAWDMLRFLGRFMASAPDFTLLAEDSEGHEGYSNPYRALPIGEPGEGLAALRLDFRLRDFSRSGLAARAEQLRGLAAASGLGEPELVEQYVNMGPRVAHRPELVTWPQAAAAALGRQAPRRPIRGGTGVDPFLDRGIPIANLGTGYFAPESEKELTSLQMMGDHVRWLLALVQVLADALPPARSA